MCRRARPVPAAARGLLALWPSYLAFTGSFLSILIMWVNHHGLFRLVNGISPVFLFANGLLLFFVTVIPFPTSVLSEYLARSGINIASALYCATYVFISLGYNLLWFAAAHQRRLIRPHVSQRTLIRVTRAYQFGLPFYLLSTAIALPNAYLGLLMTLSLWLLWARLITGRERRGEVSRDSEQRTPCVWSTISYRP